MMIKNPICWKYQLVSFIYYSSYSKVQPISMLNTIPSPITTTFTIPSSSYYNTYKS